VRHVLHPFEEPSAEALERAGRAAALPFERISEAVENAAATASSPGPCYDKCKRRIVRPGRDRRDRAAVLRLPERAGARERLVRLHRQGRGRHHPAHVTVRGTFYGNNALGRVKGRGGKSQYDPLSNCKGDEPFWARRLDPEPA
jgi:hypothetical protein